MRGCQAYATYACVRSFNAAFVDNCDTYTALGSNVPSGEASLWAGITFLLSFSLLCHAVLLATTTFAVRRRSRLACVDARGHGLTCHWQSHLKFVKRMQVGHGLVLCGTQIYLRQVDDLSETRSSSEPGPANSTTGHTTTEQRLASLMGWGVFSSGIGGVLCIAALVVMGKYSRFVDTFGWRAPSGGYCDTSFPGGGAGTTL